MLIEVIPAPYFGTNCWILANGRNSECLIVDPGIGGVPAMAERIGQVVNQNGLKPVAILLTHGHLDHTFSVLPVASGYGIPAYIHGKDRALLADPWPALMAGGELRKLMTQLGVESFSEPEDVRTVSDNDQISIAGLELTTLHSPGHTSGSTMFVVQGEHLLSGDVLFAGGIGRTDLPTGSASAMISTLRHKVLTLDDALIVYPGHGPQTTIGRERKSNPYLRDEFLTGKWG